MSRIRQIGGLLARLARELADETAYQRHLKAHGRSASPQEWRRFLDERLRSKFTRPKCC